MSNKKNERDSQLDSAAAVLQNLMKGQSNGLSDAFLRWRLWNSWAELVGAEIAASSLPVGYLKGTLYVWCKSSARMQELTFMVRPLMQKINTFIGKRWVRSIRFTLDRKDVPAPEETSEEFKSFIEK